MLLKLHPLSLNVFSPTLSDVRDKLAKMMWEVKTLATTHQAYYPLRFVFLRPWTQKLPLPTLPSCLPGPPTPLDLGISFFTFISSSRPSDLLWVTGLPASQLPVPPGPLGQLSPWGCQNFLWVPSPSSHGEITPCPCLAPQLLNLVAKVRRPG